MCTLCRNNKYQLHNDTDIRRHQWLVSHKNNVSKYNIKLEERHKVVEENDQFNLDSSSNLEPEQQRLSQHLSIPTMKYYLMENYSLGAPFLYASSFFPYNSNIYDQVTTHDAAFCLRFGDFVFSLSKQLLEKFTVILGGIRKYMLPDYPNEDSQPGIFSLKLPLTSRALKTTFLNTKTCLHENLPIPKLLLLIMKTPSIHLLLFLNV